MKPKLSREHQLELIALEALKRAAVSAAETASLHAQLAAANFERRAKELVNAYGAESIDVLTGTVNLREPETDEPDNFEASALS